MSCRVGAKDGQFSARYKVVFPDNEVSESFSETGAVRVEGSETAT